MRKIVLFAFLLSISSIVFADFRKPARFFEIGIDASVNASNNYFDARDILKETVVFDLQKISSEMPSDGFKVDVASTEKVFMNLNLSNSLRIGVFAGLDVNSNVNVGKEIFDLLGKGYMMGTLGSSKLKGYADIFADVGFSVYKVLDGFGIKVSPSYYMPIAYVPETTAELKWHTLASGEMLAEVTAPVDIYTAVYMNDFFYDDNYKINEIDINVGELLKNGGFELSFEAEHNILWGVDASLFGTLPIVPGKLKYKTTMLAHAYAIETNVLAYLNDEEYHDSDYSIDEWRLADYIFPEDFRNKTIVDPLTHIEYDNPKRKIYENFTKSKREVNHAIYKPLKLGLKASVHPLGNWINIEPMLAMVIRNPYTSDYKIYPEYALDISASLFGILVASAGTAYLNKVYVQRAGLKLNFRVIELIAQASLRSAEFKNSFKWSGAGGYVGLRIGF